MAKVANISIGIKFIELNLPKSPHTDKVIIPISKIEGVYLHSSMKAISIYIDERKSHAYAIEQSNGQSIEDIYNQIREKLDPILTLDNCR